MWNVRKQVCLLFICLSIFIDCTFPVAAQSTEQMTEPITSQIVQKNQQGEGITILWDLPTSSVVSSSQSFGVATSQEAMLASVQQQLPLLRYQGYELPIKLYSVQIDDPTALAQIEAIAKNSDALSTHTLARAAIRPAAPLQPEVMEFEGENSVSPLEEKVALPSSPLFVVRAGMIDGQLTAVLALSPIYEERGELKLATHLQLFVPGLSALQSQNPVAASSALSAAPSSLNIPQTPPTNPALNKQAVQIAVSTPGMQIVSAEALAAAGLNLGAIDPRNLNLVHNDGTGAGQSVALQALPSEIRFYADKVGDRWNSTERYWLTLEANPGKQMTYRSVAPNPGFPSRTSVLVKGLWLDNQLYDSAAAGTDSDHWFQAFLDIDASTKDNPNSVTAAIQNPLPAVSGSSRFYANFSPSLRTKNGRKCTSFDTQITVGGDIFSASTTVQAETNLLPENWTQLVTGQAPVSTVQIIVNSITPSSVPADDSPCFVRVDNLRWEQQSTLNFNGKSVAFSGEPGDWTYTWQNPPSNFTLYDVTVPNAPVILTDATASGFSDGPDAKEYVIASTTSGQRPTVSAYTPLGITAIAGAHAIYITPSRFKEALNSLVALRQAQGYQVAVVDVQAIYDGWSFGQVSPQAIRQFLQYAYSNWNPKPLSVVLVGDGTIDPKNYEVKNNINFIPPYVDDQVDPWLREAACDNCYVQLQGDDPITGDGLPSSSQEVFDIDMMIGRLPVKNEGELQSVVKKLVAYETATDFDATWRSTSLYIADNHVRKIENGSPIFDQAGDFAELSDEIRSLQPSKSFAQRFYYDPFPQYADPTGDQSWRIRDGGQMKSLVINAASQGAGLVTYTGHSNHWNMGNMEPSTNPPTILSLYDVDGYTNNNKFFIQLSMTCLTSQFVKPAVSGTTIDERTFLSPIGGAVALWGPSGISVAHGHDRLQLGFHRALWQSPSFQTPIGQMLDAGYQQLLNYGLCCQDALRTFVFFGDPLMRVGITSKSLVWLPIGKR